MRVQYDEQLAAHLSIVVQNSKKRFNVEQNLDYEIQPDAALSNGDTVTVRVQYDEQLAAHLSIVVQNSKKRFNVEQLVNDKNIQTGKNSQNMDVEIIDGIDVPVAWGLDEEAKLEYVQGQKKAQQITVPDDEDTQDDLKTFKQAKTHRIWTLKSLMG